jgi:hypothetical protein
MACKVHPHRRAGPRRRAPGAALPGRGPAPENYTVYGNAWLVERSGVIYELDAVVVAPHAVFVVEIKGYRGRIEGTDNDWYIPHPIPSPLKLNRITSQVLKGLLKRESYQAGQVWVEGLAFLSATTDCGVRGPASKDRIHTRKTILAALQDPALVERLSNGRTRSCRRPPRSPSCSELFTGAQSGPKPPARARVRGLETLDHHDTFTELLGRNALQRRARPADLHHPAAGDRRPARAHHGARPLGGPGARTARPQRRHPQRRPALPRRGRHRAPARALQGHHPHHLARALRPRRPQQGEAGRPVRPHRPVDAHRPDPRRGPPPGRRAPLLRPEVILVEDRPTRSRSASPASTSPSSSPSRPRSLSPASPTSA